MQIGMWGKVMQIHTDTILRKSNLLRFIIIKSKYERAKFFFRTNKGKVSFRRIMDQAEVCEAVAKRWERSFREEWSNR